MTPLFRQVLGETFDTLAAPVQVLHRVQGTARYVGRVDVEPATRGLARLLARVTHLPSAMRDAPLVVDFTADGTHETWRRSFDGHVMPSRLHVRGGRLCEWLGPVRFTFDLRVENTAVLWRVARVHVLGLVPLPARWFAAIHCREAGDGDRYTFLIDAAMPGVGRLVRYTGWLERA